VTVDEEFTKLEDDIRRLKVEYEVYFNGGSPRPPHDTLFRVESTIKRYSSDQSKLSFGQRFRFTNLVQKYAVNAQLWRRRLQEREEGRSLTGAQKRPVELPPMDGTVRVVCSDPEKETEKVDQLYSAFLQAKQNAGEETSKLNQAGFKEFVRKKTKDLQEKKNCRDVEYVVEMLGGHVKLKALVKS